MSTGVSVSLACERAFRPEEGLVDALPQRAPFRFVDVIDQVSQEGIVGSYQFRGDESFFEGHFPGNPVVPGVVLIETMAQVGVVALGIYLQRLEDPTGQRQMLTLFSECRIEFLSVVRPGDTVVVSARPTLWRRKQLRVMAEATVNGRVVARGELSGCGVSG